MAIGVSIGYFIPSSSGFINSFSSGTTNVPCNWNIDDVPPLTKIDFRKYL
jgi:ACR3 family arsenite transporter